MNKLLEQFKINEKPKLSDSIEILFDFVVVALVSLIFNGFIINNLSSVFDQKYLMVANAMLLSTHWYAYNFFRQRYEKKNVFFRISTFLSVLSLAIMATGIDLMVFRENLRISDPLAYEYLRWVAPMILLGGFISSRFLIIIKFALAAYANKEEVSILKLSIWKSLSRIFVVIFASLHLALIALGFPIDVTTYVFFPIYLVIELLGNLVNVKDKYLKDASGVSIGYARQRFSKLNLLYISSFVISGTIQFAYYFKTSSDLFMIARLIMVYIIAFMFWWLFTDRIYRFKIKQDAFNLKLISCTNILSVGSLAIIGGMLINANKDSNLNVIIPSVFIASALFLSMLIINTKVFINGPEITDMPQSVKYKFMVQLLPIIILFLILGIVSIYFDFSIWVLSGTLLGCLALLNFESRYTINKYIKMV